MAGLVLTGTLVTGCGSDDGGDDVVEGVLVRQSTATQSGDLAIGVVSVSGERAVLTLARTDVTPREERDVTLEVGESTEAFGRTVTLTQVTDGAARLVVEE